MNDDLSQRWVRQINYLSDADGYRCVQDFWTNAESVSEQFQGLPFRKYETAGLTARRMAMTMNIQILRLVKSEKYAPAIMPMRIQHHFNKAMSSGVHMFVLNSFITFLRSDRLYQGFVE